MRTFDEQKCIWCFAKIYLVRRFDVQKYIFARQILQIYLMPKCILATRTFSFVKIYFYKGKCLAYILLNILFTKCTQNVHKMVSLVFCIAKNTAKQSKMHSHHNFAKQNYRFLYLIYFYKIKKKFGFL